MLQDGGQHPRESLMTHQLLESHVPLESSTVLTENCDSNGQRDERRTFCNDLKKPQQGKLNNWHCMLLELIDRLILKS